MEKNMDISIVVPLLNEVDSLNELTDLVVEQLKKLDKQFEIIFIDDGSNDGSFEVLKRLKENCKEIKVIRFRKNFGKSAALSEGFKRANGEIVITMDADLQDDPTEIPNLVTQLNNGFDLVSGWKKKRNDPITKTAPSKLFNFVTRLLTGIKIHDFNCGLKGYRREVIKAIPVYGELHRYLPVLAHWQGFKVGEIVVKHHARKHGKTKFGARRFFSGFFDLLTVLFITRYGQKPMHLFGFFGVVCVLFGFIISLYLTIIWIQGQGIGHRPLLFLGILLIIVGVQSFSLGLIGDMTSSIQNQSVEYLIREEID
jgi:glycosyltransferase involved in cell wall biosynthesis